VPDDRIGRAAHHRAVLRDLQPGEQSQQGRLAGAVGPDQPDDITRGDDEIQPGEQHPITVTGSQAGGVQRRAHVGADVIR
jgi:hypothetical protein